VDPTGGWLVIRTSGDEVAITVETKIDDATAARYYELYQATFGELETRAVARQLLHEDEFFEEMRDSRVHKYVAWDGDEVIGMSTLTKDLSTVPWISPRYFAHHYPEHTARDAVYYLGFTLVHGQRRRTRVFRAMIEKIVELLVEERAVCGYDLCQHNDVHLGLGPSIEKLLLRASDVTVETIDVQTYYAATFHGAGPEPQTSTEAADHGGSGR
jgi:hypothetical protein